MPNTRLKVSKVEEHVRRKLGDSSIEVELVDEDFRTCLHEAIDVYNRHRPQRMNAALPVTAEQKRYGPINHPGVQGIVRVEFVRESVHTGDIDPFDPYSHTHGVTLGHGETYGSYAQQLGYQEEARRVTSSEPEWRSDWERDNNLYIYADIPPGADYLCSYTYTWHVTPDNNADTGMQHIPDGDVDWVLKFVLALAKQILGRIRGKFHGIPMPDGGEEDNDYAELIEEGRTDEEKFLEEIKLRQRPLSPVIG